MIDLRIAVGLGVDSKSFHMIELKQYPIKKFCMFLTSGDPESKGVAVDMKAHSTSKIDILVDQSILNKWI